MLSLLLSSKGPLYILDTSLIIFMICKTILPPCGLSSEGILQSTYVLISLVRLCATLRTAARQAPLSLGFSRQEYWNELLCLPPGNLPHPGIELVSLSLLYWQVGSLPPAPSGKASYD